MSLATQGDADAAERMARQAMVEHDRILIRFERARAQLLLGQLQRRQRQKGTATETLKQALAAFEDIGNSAVGRSRPRRTRAHRSRPRAKTCADPL